MRMEGYRGRGFSVRGGYRGDRFREPGDRGPPRSSQGRGFYESSRGRYDMSRGRRYEGSYISPQTEDQISRKRSHFASGSSEYHSRGRPSHDDSYYSGRRPSKSWIPSASSWDDDGRHERKRLKSVIDSYSEGATSRRHDGHHYARSENQERRGYREEQPRHGSRGSGRYYTSSYDEYHGDRRESKYPFSRSQYSPPRRGYISRPTPGYSPRGAGTRLRGRGLGLERGYGSLRFLRRGGTAYDFSFGKFARKREWFSVRRSVFRTPGQRGLFLRRRALDNRLFFARNRRFKRDADDSELEDWEDDDDEDELKEKKGKSDEGKDDESGEAGSKDKAKGGRVQVTIKRDQEGRAVNKNDDSGRQRIKLLCPHCKYRAITFMEYNYHLRMSRHIRALNSVSYYIKMALSKMLIKQRTMQKDLEKKKEEDGGELSEKSNYCSICKLLYRDPKPDHQGSEMHKLLKKFLQPFCVVCEMSFTSPMSYEKHTASLFHMKKKARANKWKTDEGGDSMQGDEEPPEFDEEVNPDNMMTVDTVGDVDEEQQQEDGENAAKKTNDKVKEKDDETETPKPKITITVSPAGEKYVKKLSVFYCSLCRRYLRQMHPLEKAALLHSSRRMHIRNRRQKKKQLAAKEAAAAAKEKQAEKQAEGESHDGKEAMEVETGTETKQLEKDGVTSTEDVTIKKEDVAETEGKEHTKTLSESEDKEGLEDKLWDDMDRDLGELLKEVDSSNTKGNDSGELDKNVDDDDEQGEQERWDRLKTSQKVKVPLESKSDEAEEDMKTEEEVGDD